MSGEVTRWLERLREGDPGALDRLVPLLYDDLRQIARRLLRGESDRQGLATTALVHELYLRLRDQEQIGDGERGAFFAAAAVTMRRILIDAARSRRRLKRGSGARPVPLEDIESFFSDREAEEMLALDIALGRLQETSPRAARVVELRYFAGLSVEEASVALGVNEKTVRRDWLAARAWLQRELSTSLPSAD